MKKEQDKQTTNSKQPKDTEAVSNKPTKTYEAPELQPLGTLDDLTHYGGSGPS